MPLEFRDTQSGDDLGIRDAQRLFRIYQEGLGIDLDFQGFEHELATLPGKYGPPGGALVVVYDGEDAIACGALKDLGDGIAEVKRLYVAPSHRGNGLGRTITERLMDRARSMGYHTVRLDTLRRLEAAVSLYRRMGFQEIAPYNFNPEPDIVYLERPL